jgi:hypothetical protein
MDLISSLLVCKHENKKKGKIGKMLFIKSLASEETNLLVQRTSSIQTYQYYYISPHFMHPYKSISAAILVMAEIM